MESRRGRIFSKIMSVAVLGACMGAVVGTSTNAYAGRYHRNLCVSDVEGYRGRLAGETNAKRLLNRIWSSRAINYRCDKLERVTNLISDIPLARPTSGGLYAACFYQGYIEGLYDNLEQKMTSCADKCFAAGAAIGGISAQGYCAASMALGGLDDPGFIRQPALPLCGMNVIMGCKTEYMNVAMFDYPGCSEFTEGYFEVTFDNIVRQDCFVPSDVPIRNYSASANSSHTPAYY